MKNLLLCSFLLFLLNSCSSDFDSNLPATNDDASQPAAVQILPENKANPYDWKGKQYFEALTYYQHHNQFPNSIKEITSQIRFIASYLGRHNQTNKSIILFTNAIVESIMSDPDNSLITIVQNSELNSDAKTSLINFLENLIIERQLEFSVTYAYIVDYENMISSSTLTTDEKDTILTVASICRYSLYSESERKDRDWESSAGNKRTKLFFSKNETSIISIIALLEVIL